VYGRPAMRLYHRRHAGRPIRAAWTLEEAGQAYEVVLVDAEERKSDSHLARHPLGKVPALEDDGGETVFESAAICLHVADLFPEARLIADPGTHDRALVYQWAVFAPAELEPPLLQSLYTSTDHPELSAKELGRFGDRARVISRALGERDFLVGDSFTVADVMVGTALAFTIGTPAAAGLPQNLQDYVTRLGARPAYQSASARTTA
jgi:glutathione S-transferase